MPGAVGANVTVIAQLDPATRTEPQLLVCTKSPALVPVTVMLVIFSVTLPTLERVTVWGELVVPTVC